MTLVLSNEEIERVLTMADLIPALEAAYRDLDSGAGANGVRCDVVTPTARRADGHYALKSMSGVAPRFGVGAVRINSDILTFPESGGSKRRVKEPAAPGARYVGLVLLFGTADGAPLLICPDGVMQRMRVGATNAIAASRLARKSSGVVAMIGAGWQAGAQLMGLAQMLPVQEVRVFSPRRDSRERFAAEMGAALELPVHAAASGAEACRGADIVVCATNALGPVFFADWLEPGQYVSSIRPGAVEIEPAARGRFDLMAVFNEQEQAVSVHTKGIAGGETRGTLPAGLPTLPALVAGRHPGRTSAGETICFINNMGMGYQFAVAGHVVYEKARAMGIGRELPTEWFTETVVP